jgi:micrococcal nuclease
MTPSFYTYKAKVISVYDGDTITVETDLGFDIKVKQKIRLANIDTPEIRGEERPAGLIARDALREKILDKEVVIETIKDKTGKYGRYLGIVHILEPLLNENEGETGYVNVNNWLVENKYAEIYK